jgi:CHAD domain-containing protein
MVRKGKWIDGTSAEQPVSAAARHALELRLAVLWHYLPLAARHADEDIEYVHQLRVASRRAVATLELFREVLPPRRAKWLLKQLKQVRRAAGAARDDDVFLERLEAWQRKRPAVAMVLKQVRRHRRQAQKPVEKIHRKLVRKDFERQLSQFLKRIRWRGKQAGEPCFGRSAWQSLQQLVAQFEACAAGDFTNLEALHQFRIASKRLRYAMELFSAAFVADFRQQLYPQVEQLQELLGSVNDHAVARARLDCWLVESDDEQLSGALRKLAAAEHAAVKQSRARFLEHWTPERAADLRGQFARYLDANPPGC